MSERPTIEVSKVFGEWTVDLLDVGGLSLDGGSMFGSVPRGLWGQWIPPDEQHRIPLAMRCLLLRHASTGAVVLVDTGVGDKFDEKFANRFAVRAPEGAAEDLPLAYALGRVGVGLGEVTHVLLTHLHFDHGGGLSGRNASGDLAPTFPEATHWVQRQNLETAEAPNPRERASYLPDNVGPLRDAPLEIVDGETELLPGLSVLVSHGHTSGMQMVRLEGGGRVLFYPADLAPTHHHVPVAFTMGYDLCSREIMAEKSRIWPSMVEDEAVVVFEHDHGFAAGRLGVERGRYGVREEVRFVDGA
ncbi:MAG: MBL fold metallo-hydrolase [Planctomycetota bacterium]